MIIYQITNLVNRKIYIGKTKKTKEQRFKEHIKFSKLGQKTALALAIKKYGEENFTLSILEENISTNEELNKKEIYYISLYKPQYNMTKGGDGGSTLSIEQIKEFSERTIQKNHKMKGKTLVELYGSEKAQEIKNSISKKQKNIPKNLSEEQIKKKSEYMKNNNPMKNGHKLESRIKISQTLKERNINVGDKNGMRKRPEAKKKIGEKNSKFHHLKNIQDNTEILIKNLTAWAREQNLNPSTVAVSFCKNQSINNWIRVGSYFQSSLPEHLLKLENN